MRQVNVKSVRAVLLTIAYEQEVRLFWHIVLEFLVIVVLQLYVVALFLYYDSLCAFVVFALLLKQAVLRVGT